MSTEVTNLQYRSYLSVAKELNQIDTTNLGPWVLDNEGNILYDLEWLHTVGIEVKGNLYDIQVAEPLLDEERKEGYSLQVLSETRFSASR